ncbi:MULTISPECIES: LysR family transcriptional regulator [Yersinia]|uniref:LysR family transcriptional regulator n=1 Tax=Yersinia TaxID=629 RepID=UPI000EABD4A2|nr:LysR family transcriptional regulator [Yersinia sp. IP36721]
MNRIPSLKLLMGFEAAARLGSFARAADELCLSQSAISHQISQIEAQTGQPLFRRVGRGVELTVAGEVLQRTVLRTLETLRSGMSRIATYLDPGLVAMVCPSPILQGWLQPRLDALQQQIPDLCPLLSSDETARFIDEIDVDIAIGSRPLDQEGLLQLPFLQDEWVMVASAAVAEKLILHPANHHSDITSLICLEEHLTGEKTGALLASLLQRFRLSAIYDDQSGVMDAVRRGRGMALLSRLAADSGLQDGTLAVVDDYAPLPGQTFWISRVAGEARSPQVMAAFAWLQQQNNISESFQKHI